MDDDLVLYSIYLWICIAKIELKLQKLSESHHMFTTYDLDTLIFVLLKHLCRERILEKDDEWNPFKASAICIMFLSNCLEQVIY